MLFLSIGPHWIKAMLVHRSLLGQYTVASEEKKFNVQLLKSGKVASADILASALKEVIQKLSVGNNLKNKQLFLILPQDSFALVRTEVPNDITASAIVSFAKEKARTALNINLDTYTFDYLFSENEDKKNISIFAMDESVLSSFRDCLRLVDLHISSVIPESLAYFKLFEKTLRKGKIEHILYGHYEPDSFSGYLYDSFGLIEQKQIIFKLQDGKEIEKHLKKIGEELETKYSKLNRLILSGTLSDSIRQDTFTKDVGIWTNPLKRILPHFYSDYLKMLVTQHNAPFPILSYDVCFGSLIFTLEAKQFNITRHRFSHPSPGVKSGSSFRLPQLRIPKELVLFLLSFALSLGLFTILSKTPAGFRFSLPEVSLLQKPTATPTPAPTATPTPTPTIERETVKIRILNGSGTAGKASELRNILKEKGYSDLVTGNADNFDFVKSEISVKKNSDSLYQVVASDLKSVLKEPKKTVLDSKDSADVVITFGSDFD